MIKLAIFDWNGTILADVTATVEGFNRQLQALGQRPVSRQAFLDSFETPISRMFANVGVDLAEFDDKLRLDAAHAFHNYYEPRINQGRTRIGVRKTLQTLSSRGTTCIVLSNHTTKEIQAQIVRLRLEPFFSTVLAHDSIGRNHHEDKQQYLENFLRGSRFRPDQSVIIGDSVNEILIGQQLGIPSIAISGGFTSTARLLRAKPDILIRKMTNVVKAIEEIQ